MKSPNWNYEIGWSPIERVCGYGGHWVEIGYNKEGVGGYTWCVQCCGTGYYFKSRGECYAYCLGRNFYRGRYKPKIHNEAEANAYCVGRGLHKVLSDGRSLEHCLKHDLCEVSAYEV